MYVLTVCNNSSPLTLILFITYNRHSTVLSSRKAEKRLENLSKSCIMFASGRTRMTPHTIKTCLFGESCAPF